MNIFLCCKPTGLSTPNKWTSELREHRKKKEKKNRKLSRVIKEKDWSRRKLRSQHKWTEKSVVLSIAYASWAIKLTLRLHTCIPIWHIYWRSRKLMLAYKQLLSTVNHCRTSLEAYCLPFISRASRNPVPSSACCLAIKWRHCLLGRGRVHQSQSERQTAPVQGSKHGLWMYVTLSQVARSFLQRFDFILFPFLEKNKNSSIKVHRCSKKVRQKPVAVQGRMHAQICNRLEWMEIKSIVCFLWVVQKQFSPQS